MKCWKLNMDGGILYLDNLRVALCIAKTYKKLGTKKITLKWGEYHA